MLLFVWCTVLPYAMPQSLSLSLGFLCSTALVLVIIVVVPVPLPLTHHRSTEIGQRDNTNYENDMPCAYDDVLRRREGQREGQAESQISLRDPSPVRPSVSSTAAQQQCWTMDGQWTRKITIGCMKSNIVASRLGLGLSRAGEIFARR